MPVTFSHCLLVPILKTEDADAPDLSFLDTVFPSVVLFLPVGDGHLSKTRRSDLSRSGQSSLCGAGVLS